MLLVPPLLIQNAVACYSSCVYLPNDVHFVASRVNSILLNTHLNEQCNESGQRKYCIFSLYHNHTLTYYIHKATK